MSITRSPSRKGRATEPGGAHCALRAWRGLHVALLAALAQPGIAADLDPHALFESRCAVCHDDHAGAFVRQTLVTRDGMPVSQKTGRPIAELLAAGHGDLSPAETDALIAHFAAILDANGLFEAKCRVCHDRAVDLARRNLVLRGNHLFDRYTERDIEAFLATHGRLDAAEIETIVTMLKRQLR